ncbi:uncharacterized protein LOC107265981 [Cephus cinctus]|uniref:Uncharacterized protein LOC107265981 n=1 Tax=Cephus cinctus TaxID=211228 RepID=A0AAJ7BQ03_CEPCN|nr:uncharacterized protein LOC107265981 [Cephus cinctus]
MAEPISKRPTVGRTLTGGLYPRNHARAARACGVWLLLKGLQLFLEWTDVTESELEKKIDTRSRARPLARYFSASESDTPDKITEKKNDDRQAAKIAKTLLTQKLRDAATKQLTAKATKDVGGNYKNKQTEVAPSKSGLKILKTDEPSKKVAETPVKVLWTS